MKFVKGLKFKVKSPITTTDSIKEGVIYDAEVIDTPEEDNVMQVAFSINGEHYYLLTDCSHIAGHDWIIVEEEA